MNHVEAKGLEASGLAVVLRDSGYSCRSSNQRCGVLQRLKIHDCMAAIAGIRNNGNLRDSLRWTVALKAGVQPDGFMRSGYYLRLKFMPVN
jgi:hypothetical protein